LFVPAGTPPAVIDRLQQAMAASLREPAIREKFVAAGFEPKTSSPSEFAALVREEIEKWRPVVRTSGATPD
jgi:tripartite-type tricarboxylate transporter receptor subunit TctC